MQILNTHGIRQHFARILNIHTIKEIFHCLNREVDLDDIFNPPAAELNCTFYSNMCEYVLENRVKPGNNRSKANDDKLFESFRLIAHEEAFADLEVEDIPVRPRKPANKKRHPEVKPVALSQSDDAFKIFGPSGGVTPRLPKEMREKAGAEGADGFVPAAKF